MSESSPAMRIGVAVSIAVHLAALIAGLGYAGFHLRPSGPEQSIAVDLITPEEVAELAKPPEQTTTPSPQPENVIQPPEQKPPTPPQDAPQPKPDSSKQSAASKPETTPPQPQPPPVQQQPQASQPAAQPSQPQAAIQQPEPDLSVRYPMNMSLFGSAPGDFDAKADSTAQIDGGTAAAFRAQLKNCSTLPKEIKPDDKVAIVIRAEFQLNGRLAATPILIEASNSPKGPYLMQAAIAALQACQPYASLPADKYQEWKMLDLNFTPRDFKPG